MKIRKKRRHENKTDYKARKSLLKKGLPRIAVRITNRYIVLQYIESKEAKDRVICGVSSKKLLKFGWPKEFLGSLKSLAASYLSGLLIGKMIKEKFGQVETIIDIGLLRNKQKGRVYAAVKGVIDAGIKVKCKEEIFPDDKRIRGSSKFREFDKIKDKIENE